MDAYRTAWPRLGEGLAGAPSDLGRACSRLGPARPQDIPAVPQGGPGAPPRGRQRVPEDRRALPWRRQSRPLQRPSDDRPDGDRGRTTARRRLHADADPPGRPARAHVGERGHSSGTDIGGQRQTIPPAPCASHEECAGCPLQVLSRHGDDCSRAPAKAREHEHDGVIPLTGGLGAIAAL